MYFRLSIKLYFEVFTLSGILFSELFPVFIFVFLSFNNGKAIRILWFSQMADFFLFLNENKNLKKMFLERVCIYRFS